MPAPRTHKAGQRTRIAQLERDLTRAVNRLLAEFAAETGSSPHAIDLELVREAQGRNDTPQWVVSGTRTFFSES